MKLSQAIKRVKHAAGRDPDRSNLMATHFESHGKGTAIVATDGHRMSVAYAAAREGLPATVPLDAALKAMTLRGLIDAAREYEGKFPDWRQVVPKDDPRVKLKVDRTALLNTLRITQATIKIENKIARLEVSATEHQIKVAQTRNRIRKLRGESLIQVQDDPIDPIDISLLIDIRSDEIVIDTSNRGTPGGNSPIFVSAHSERFEKALTIGINAKYFLDAVRALSGETIQLEINDPLSPIVLRDDQGFELVMPMRI